jgi:hypothetical protein
MDAAEEYVRSRWALPQMMRRYSGGTVSITAQQANESWTWVVFLAFDESRSDYLAVEPAQPTEALAWQAAYEFTLAREEEIRLVREEIALVRDSYQTCFKIGSALEFKDETRKKMAAEALVWQRILAREQAHLDSILVGWKGK